jgi:hypothetical protein
MTSEKLLLRRLSERLIKIAVDLSILKTSKISITPRSTPKLFRVERLRIKS